MLPSAGGDREFGINHSRNVKEGSIGRIPKALQVHVTSVGNRMS